MGLKQTKDDTDKLLKAVRELCRNEVLVGVPDSSADRQLEPGENSTASNALIGYILEIGSPAKNIPPRPFLVPGIEGARDAIVAQMKKGGEAALDGKTSEIEMAQTAAGLIAQSAVKAKIVSNIPPPLAQRTLDARRRRGFAGTNTLVETGQFLNSISFVVRPRGD